MARQTANKPASVVREDSNGSQSIAAVERAIDVLLLFGRSSAASLGVTEIASELEMPKAAVHRILTSLRSRDMISFDADARRYLLGPAAVALGRAYLAKIDVRAIAADELATLSAETGETATLSIRNGDRRIYVDQVLPAREVRMEVVIGSAHPLHAGASSKAFLAFLGTDEARSYLARNELARLTDRTVTDSAKLLRELAGVRRRGYAVSIGERQAGAASVASPVFDHEGSAVAVVSVCGPAERLKPSVAECTDALLTATKRLSSRLGFAPTS